MPSRYWEPGREENTEREQDTRIAQDWIEQNGIQNDADLPFN